MNLLLFLQEARGFAGGCPAYCLRSATAGGRGSECSICSGSWGGSPAGRRVAGRPGAPHGAPPTGWVSSSKSSTSSITAPCSTTSQLVPCTSDGHCADAAPEHFPPSTKSGSTTLPTRHHPTSQVASDSASGSPRALIGIQCQRAGTQIQLLERCPRVDDRARQQRAIATHQKSLRSTDPGRERPRRQRAPIGTSCASRPCSNPVMGVGRLPVPARKDPQFSLRPTRLHQPGSRRHRPLAKPSQIETLPRRAQTHRR